MASALARMAERAADKQEAKKATARLVALRHVLNGQIEFHVTVGPSGGFTGVGGALFRHELEVLIALWHHRSRALIAVQGTKVTLTSAGLRQLTEWERGGGAGA